MVIGVTTRNRKLYMDLIEDLEDLGSTTLREHWYYRRERFYINTNAHVNPEARKLYVKLLELARMWRKEHGV